MAFKAGKDSWLGIDGVAGSQIIVNPYVDNVSWPASVQTLDVSAFGTTAKAFIPGLTDGDQITMSGPLDVVMGTILSTVKAAQAAGSSTSTLRYGPGGSVAGQINQSAECWLAGFSFSSGVGGRAEYSATWQITGAVTVTTW